MSCLRRARRKRTVGLQATQDRVMRPCVQQPESLQLVYFPPANANCPRSTFLNRASFPLVLISRRIEA